MEAAAILDEFSRNFVNNLLTQKKRSALEEKHKDLLNGTLERVVWNDPYDYIGTTGSHFWEDLPGRPKASDLITSLLAKNMDWTDLSKKLNAVGYDGIYLGKIPKDMGVLIKEILSNPASGGDQISGEYEAPPRRKRAQQGPHINPQ